MPRGQAQVSDSWPGVAETSTASVGYTVACGMPLCLCWLVLALALACCCQPATLNCAPESCDVVVASGGCEMDVIFIKRRCAKTATRLAAAVAAEAALGNAAVDRLGVADIGRWASLLFFFG